MDVTQTEENKGGPVLTVACFPESEKIVLMDMSQRFHLDYLPKVLEVAIDGCKAVKSKLDEIVRGHVNEVGAMSSWGHDIKIPNDT